MQSPKCSTNKNTELRDFMRANAIFNNKILGALILTVLLFAIGASAGPTVSDVAALDRGPM
jgi:hypothetical protein